MRRWPGRIIAFKEAPVGVEPTQSCFAGSRRAVWLQRHVIQCPHQESHRAATPSVGPSTFARSRADPAHSEDISHSSALPRNRTPSCRFVVCRAIRYTCRAFLFSVSTRNRTWIWTFGGSYAILCTIETISIPTWSRTRARALGEPCAIRYTIGTFGLLHPE